MNTRADSSRTILDAGLDLLLLQDALELAEGAVLLFAVCEGGTWQQRMMELLEGHLKAQGREIVRVELSPQRPDLIATLSSRYDIASFASPSAIPSLRDRALPAVVFVEMERLDRAGLDISYLPPDSEARKESEAARRALQAMNLQREQLAGLNLPFVFWLDRPTLTQLIRYAADLFAARSGIFYLEMPQLPAQYARIEAIEMEMARRIDHAGRTFLPPQEVKRRIRLYEERLAREQSAPEPHWPGLAWTAQELADLYREQGELARAAEYRKQAAAIYRRLSAQQSPEFISLLARTLGELGSDLSDLGRREEALAATEEAVGLYRQLAQANPQAFLPDLATSLNNLGKMLSDLGRREAALAATEEAVALYRALAQAHPQAFLPDLAMSLNNLGSDLSELGRREEALAAAEEAAALYRGLAQQNPQAFLPDLATSLHNLGKVLSELGRREAALAATEEAVGLYRELAQQNPQAFLPDLATSLGAHGSVLLGLGRPAEAAAAFAEGARLLLPHARALPQAFSGLLQALLGDYQRACQAAGHAPDADLLRLATPAILGVARRGRPLTTSA